MWTRAPSITSCVIDGDHEEEVGGASSNRFHHRGSGSNHQPSERDSRLLQDESSSAAAAAVGVHTQTLRRDESPTIHHDLPNPPGACKLKKRSLPSSRSRTGFIVACHPFLSSMSSPELATRVRPRQQQSRGRSLEDSSVSKDFQLDDMQTQIGNATPNAPPESSPDQEVPEVVLPSPSKRRRLVYNEELNFSLSGTRSCEDSGLSSQHMADLDRASKASTPEDIDSEPPGASELGLVPQCTTTATTTTTTPPELLNVAEQETVVVEPLQILEHLHFSRHDDTPSQFLPHISRVLPDSRISTQTSRTMADEWLQLSLGQSYDEQNQQQQPRSATRTTAPMQSPSPELPGVRDFFSSEASSLPRQQVSSSPYRSRPAHSGESSKQQQQVVTVPRPLFLEPRPPRGEQFRAGSSFMPPQFSSLQYPPVRVLQPVRTEQSTDTTAVHAWRSGPHEAGPSSYGYGAAAATSSSGAPWMRHQPEPPPNPAEFLSMGTPREYRMPPFSSMQHQPQGVDPEQAWRNLLQRVGNNMTVPVGTSFPARAPMLPPGDQSEEHMDALKRAVERFQGADQDPLTELQRRRGHQQPGPSSYDPNTDISLASFYGGGGGGPSAAHGGSSSGSMQPRAAHPSAAHRRILRPHAPKPGLWFTLQASSNSQPEASPLQQIPTAYIRVVDDTMTVAAVRRYLANKLSLASEDEVELTCKGQLLQATLSLHQVRDGIWQSPNTNVPHPNTHRLLSEGKAWKAPDGSITLVGDVVMVLTYSRRPQQHEEQALPVTSS